MGVVWKALDTALNREVAIKEDDPPTPSKRLSTLGEHSTESAMRRRTELPELRRELSGDLDRITMKALEKDRTRRYSSPREFAADIERYLTDQPVLAPPPLPALIDGQAAGLRTLNSCDSRAIGAPTRFPRQAEERSP